ncbi:hypothetical protein AJ88_32005 [Mesorhizobium amorphae CCBAU 01583]|nr:hypothetical protein AJ88_32005 [Mesorhizobium amorphae CCBAU 01583]
MIYSHAQVSTDGLRHFVQGIVIVRIQSSMRNRRKIRISPECSWIEHELGDQPATEVDFEMAVVSLLVIITHVRVFTQKVPFLNMRSQGRWGTNTGQANNLQASFRACCYRATYVRHPKDHKICSVRRVV